MGTAMGPGQAAKRQKTVSQAECKVMAASNQPGFIPMLPSRAVCLTHANLQTVFNPGAGERFSNMATSN